MAGDLRNDTGGNQGKGEEERLIARSDAWFFGKVAETPGRAAEPRKDARAAIRRSVGKSDA
jgi:hypothetical protein